MVKPRENRVHMMMSDEELEAIDTWRFANRVNTRSDAIRRLCQIGLNIEQPLERTIEMLGIASNWLDGARKEMAIALPGENDKPAHIASQMNFLGIMAVTTAITIARNIQNHGDTMRSFDHVKDAIEAFKNDPHDDLIKMYELIEKVGGHFDPPIDLPS